MKIFSYIKYFSYIAFNWNIRIARFIIFQEWKGEKKYGISTTGADELKKLEKRGIDITHATIYMPVAYSLLDEVFGQLKKWNNIPSGHFLDIGSGKGRALCVAANAGYRKVTGIDLSRELCAEAVKNLERTRNKIPGLEYKILNNDAFYFEIPTDTDCIFLFNPFDEIIMSGVVQNILKSLAKNPRKILIVYVNPMHKEPFSKAGFSEIYHSKKMKYLEVLILSNRGVK